MPYFCALQELYVITSLYHIMLHMC